MRSILRTVHLVRQSLFKYKNDVGRKEDVGSTNKSITKKYDGKQTRRQASRMPSCEAQVLSMVYMIKKELI